MRDRKGQAVEKSRMLTPLVNLLQTEPSWILKRFKRFPFHPWVLFSFWRGRIRLEVFPVFGQSKTKKDFSTFFLTFFHHKLSAVAHLVPFLTPKTIYLFIFFFFNVCISVPDTWTRLVLVSCSPLNFPGWFRSRRSIRHVRSLKRNDL